MKKYRLKIPEMIRRRDIQQANDLLLYDREILPERVDSGLVYVVPEDIPKDWLEEIKDDDDRWLEREYGPDFETEEFSAADMRWAFNAGKHYDGENPGIKNNAKDEPMSAEEWVDNRFGVDTDKPFRVRETRIEIFKAGEENQKLRHRPTVPLQEYLDGWAGDKPTGIITSVWKDCLESHNLPEE